MSSPPPSASSPTGPSFSIPKKRSRLATPNPNASHRRKPSSVTSSTHPLRQTSFPPSGAASPPQYSPTRNSSFSPSVSSVGGRGVGSKKRRRDAHSVTDASVVKSAPGRNVKAGSATKEPSGGREDEEGEEDENDGVDDTVLESGGMMDEAAKKQEREHLGMLIEAFSPDQADRYDTWRRVRLKKETVRKIANQTLSQSVPASIVTTINGYTKLFIGELVERARDVQLEWLVAKNAESQAKAQALGEQTALADKALLTGDVVNVNDQKDRATPKSATGRRPTLPPGAISAANTMHGLPGVETTTLPESLAVANNDEPFTAVNGEVAANRPYDVDERDRGPLTPDHLREALRRYKKDQEGGSAGFQGLSLQGKDLVASRVGGKRTFR